MYVFDLTKPKVTYHSTRTHNGDDHADDGTNRRYWRRRTPCGRIVSESTFLDGNTSGPEDGEFLGAEAFAVPIRREHADRFAARCSRCFPE